MTRIVHIEKVIIISVRVIIVIFTVYVPYGLDMISTNRTVSFTVTSARFVSFYANVYAIR